MIGWHLGVIEAKPLGLKNRQDLHHSQKLPLHSVEPD